VGVSRLGFSIDRRTNRNSALKHMAQPKRRKRAEWREFERLAALLESHLVPLGAEVRSPDKIRDKVTGRLREVDISVSFMIDSTPMLITFECRKRGSRPDATWIEQLVTKRTDIGASETVAIASKAFTSGALKKADHHRIHTRLLQDVTDDTVKAWATALKFQVQCTLAMGSWGIHTLRLRLRELGPRDEETSRLIGEALTQAKTDPEYGFIKRSEGDKLISISDLLREHDEEIRKPLGVGRGAVHLQLPPQGEVLLMFEGFPSIFRDVPLTGVTTKRVFTVQFEPLEAFIETRSGLLEIDSLEVEAEVTMTENQIQGHQWLYADSYRPILAAEEHVISTRDYAVQVIISTNSDRPANARTYPARSEGEESL
jgi:hypothetical protein